MFKNPFKTAMIYSLMMISTLSLSAASEITSLADIIRTAREQNVLTQSILKNYLMVGMENNFKNTPQTLKTEIAQYEKNMDFLDESAVSKKAFKNIEAVRALWEPVKKILAQPESLANAQKLKSALDTLLQATYQTTKLYTRQTGTTLGIYIDAAANIEVLSQKISALYLLGTWSKEKERIIQSTGKAIDEFNASMDILTKANVNNDTIKKILKKTQDNFRFFQVMQKLKKNTIPTLLYEKSNIILQDARALSAAYSKSIIL